MKMIYIPNKCPKCENKVLLEKLENKTANAYCKYCDFILPIDKEELEYTEKYLTMLYGDWRQLPSEEERQARIHAKYFSVTKDYTEYISK